jgi:plasmid stabilization system protein ParE
VRVRLLDLAGADLIDGYRFYEIQAAGVGEYFFNTLSGEIKTLGQYAGIHQRVFGYYRMLSRRFPYAIYYTMAGDEVQVWRVLDCRRDPRWVGNQLKP